MSLSWTYFTAYLDGTRMIRHEERDELLDNFNTLLATTDCADSGYSLNATELAAMKSSFILTDLATLDPGGLHLRLETIISTVAAGGTFSNYTAARAAALSGEGISDGDLTSIRNAFVDDHRLWNYYKRLIDGLTCTPNCPTITAVDCRTRSASKTKCGFPENSGYESTPPKYYRTRSQSGSITCYTPFTGQSNTNTYSGSQTYSTPGCGSPSGSYSVQVDQNTPVCSEIISSPAVEAFAGNPFPTGSIYGNYVYQDNTCDGHIDLYIGGADTSIDITSNQITISADVTYFSGTVTITLSDEYTTSQLQDDTATALSAASWTSYGTCSGITTYRNLTSDELTFSLRHVQYKISLSGAAPDGCKLKYNYYEDGVLISGQCDSIPIGATEVVLLLDFPDVGIATTKYDDFTIDSAC